MNNEQKTFTIEDHDPVDYDALWCDWEVRQALESGDIERAAELAELSMTDRVIWM